MDVNKIRVFIVVCVAVIRIQGILGFCSEFQNETPVIRMCEANALSVGVDSSIYLDSVGAPILTKVECTCVLSFSGTGSLEIAYRANEDVPDCEIEFRMNSRTWGCKSESFSNTINQGSNNVTFIQKSEVSGVWQACLGLRSRFHSISVTCYPYRIYYAPDEVVNGVFSEWTERSACSATCGSGTQTWVRYCDNPAPRNGGELCLANNGTRTSEETEVRSCNLPECQVVNGGFGNWTASSMCSVTCGTGTQTWVRNCDSPAPSNGGVLCLADDETRTLEETETRQCIRTACPESKTTISPPTVTTTTTESHISTVISISTLSQWTRIQPSSTAPVLSATVTVKSDEKQASSMVAVYISVACIFAIIIITGVIIVFFLMRRKRNKRQQELVAECSRNESRIEINPDSQVVNSEYESLSLEQKNDSTYSKINIACTLPDTQEANIEYESLSQEREKDASYSKLNTACKIPDSHYKNI